MLNKLTKFFFNKKALRNRGLFAVNAQTLTFVVMAVQEQKNNPLHGLTLEFIVKQLFFHYGWEEMGNLVKIDCFKNNPTLKSSLKFLRKTDWARKKVEKLYLNTFH